MIKSVAGEVRNGSTTFSELYQNALSQPASGLTFHQYSGHNNQVGALRPVSHQRLRIVPHDGKQNFNVRPHATYVACSGNENFPHIIRIYDANNFQGSNYVSHHRTLSLKARLGRSCMAFVNAWRGS